jgi:hypothetical protein
MKRLIFLFILLITAIGNGFAQNVTFRGTAPNAVVVGEQFRVNYTLTTAGDRGKDVRMPETDGLKVLFGPTLSQQSSSTNIVNGNVSSQITEVHTFTLQAEKEGEFTIAPASIKVGNSEYRANEIKIKVLPPDQAAAASSANRQANAPASSSGEISNNDIFVRTIVSKSSMFENEGFLVTFKLYSLVDVTGFNDAKFPEFEGFIAQEVDLPTNQQLQLENYQGRNYRTILLKQTFLFPQRAGKITIGSGRYDVNIRVRNQQTQRPRSFFDDFFETYSNLRKTITSAPVTVDVKPLPSGKPASFTGAVGEYTLTSSISTTELKANDPITVKLVLSGNGNIRMAKHPEIVFPNSFEVYDPKVDVTTRVTTNGVSGTKTVEYYAVPRYAGNFTIPKAEFSFFDVRTQTYKTLSTQEFQLKVEADGSGTSTAPIVGATNKEDVRFVGKDIRHIKTEGFQFQKGNFFFGSFLYWLCFLIPAVLFVVLFIIYRKQAKENANIALVRTKKANKVASKRLKQANSYLKENKKEAFYDETLKAVWGYLSDKLNIPVSSLTKDNVENELIKYGVGNELINKFIHILNTAEFARFAPSGGHGAMDELYQETVEAINKMEKV